MVQCKGRICSPENFAVTNHTIRYLAWGGENDNPDGSPNFEIITADDIAKDLKNEHYSGYRLWTQIKQIAVGVDGVARLLDVTIRCLGAEFYDEDDYSYPQYEIVRFAEPNTTFVLDEFSFQIDGRA